MNRQDAAASFELSFTADAPPPGVDGSAQRRTLRGRIVLPALGRPPYPVVVIAHGYTSFMDWGFYPELSRRLAAVGIASVRFNFSGSGIGADLETMTEPELFRRNSYLHELEDLEVLYRTLRGGRWPELDPDRMSIVGHSRGGAMALVHASEVGAYRTVSTWAAIDRILNFSAQRLVLWRRQGFLDVMHWTLGRRLPVDVEVLDAAEANRGRLDIAAACARLTCPVLVVVGDADRSVPAVAGENLVRACGDRGSLVVLAGGDHVFGAVHPPREPTPAALRSALDRTISHIAACSGV